MKHIMNKKHGRQFTLTLWKDYLLRRRKPLITSAVLLWAIGTFVIMYIVRIQVQPVNVPSCEFKSRALPSAGVLPFVQTFICGLSNDCEDINSELPSFEDSRFGKVALKLEPVLTNSSFISFLKNIPPTIRFISFASDAFNTTTVKDALRLDLSTMIKNWDGLRKFLKEKLSFDDEVIDALQSGELNLNQIFDDKDPFDLNGYFCRQDKLSKLLSFKNEFDSDAIIEKISNGTCSEDGDKVTILISGIIRFISFKELFGKVSILTTAIYERGNYTAKDLVPVTNTIQQIPDMYSLFENMLGDISPLVIQLLRSGSDSNQGGTELAGVSNFIMRSSKLLCGKSIIPEDSKVLKVLADSIRGDKYDEDELAGLPTTFCQNVYKNIIDIDGGRVIWTYIKPFLKGKLLYSPNTKHVQDIIYHANQTFRSIATFEEVLGYMDESLNSVPLLVEKKDILKKIMELINSPLLNNILGLFGFSGFSFSMDFDDMFQPIIQLTSLSSFVNIGSNLMKCIDLNRFSPLKNENKLESSARTLLDVNEFIAGIVFDNKSFQNENSKNKFSNVKYKIRMDIDNVPTTARIRSKFWFPGPEANFIEDLRYFRGFVELQDMVDQAIIQLRLKDVKMPKHKIYTQQFPYPCYKRDTFLAALYETQTFQICFFFGLVMMIAAATRYIVWEKETKNSTVMKVMGLKPWINFSSWFLTSLIEMAIIMFCVVIMVKVLNMLPYSNPIPIYILLFVYGFSVIMFCYMISTIFRSANLAAVSTVIFYFLTYMPYIIIIAIEANLEYYQKILTNLFMSSSFCYGCLYALRYEVQGLGLQWDNVWESPIVGDIMNFGTTCVFLLFDGCLYGLIGYIIGMFTDESIMKHKENVMFISDQSLKAGVYIKDLSKVYKNDKKKKVAVDKVTFEMRKGQITTLLGHNGAGKTTFIKMLTGMTRSSNGHILINDPAAQYRGIEGRQYVGLCPQTNVLIGTMSAREHLMFYARLKTSKPAADVTEEVNQMLKSMSISAYENEPVSNLSGGMQRRLCVALAFIGRPALVVLDEPSSGVDPSARRHIWDLILAHKHNCTVALTTHHLDEAELLSDSIVILHKGKVHCTGSSNSLKQTYGFGYKICVTYPKQKARDSSNSTALLMTIRDVVPNASIADINDDVITIQIPFEKSVALSNSVGQISKILESDQAKLGFEHFTVICSTLEQVFLNICEQSEKNQNGESGELINADNGYVNHSYLPDPDKYSKLDEDTDLYSRDDPIKASTKTIFEVLLRKRVLHYLRDRRALVYVLILPTIFTAVAMGFSLIRPPTVDEPALVLTPDIYKPHFGQFVSYQKQDDSGYITGELLPKINSENYPLEDLQYGNLSQKCKCSINGAQECSNVEYKNLFERKIVVLSSIKETKNWLIDTQKEYVEKRYGGWSIKSNPSIVQDNETSDSYLTMTAWYNNKGYHALPSYVNRLTNAVLRTQCDNCSITTVNHPVRLSKEQFSRSTVVQHIADVGIALIIVLAFSLVSASGVIYLVEERVREEKRIQYLSGVNPILYWTTAFVWDLGMFIGSIILAIVVFEIFGLPIYVAKQNLGAVTLLLFLYGWACIPMVYLVESFFKDASVANIAAFCGNVSIGLSSLVCILLMDILGETKEVEDLRYILHKIFLILPQFNLGDGLIEISKNNIKADILSRFHIDAYDSPFEWGLMGIHYTYLIVVGAVLFAVKLFIENNFSLKYHSKTIESPKGTCLLETVLLRKEFETALGTKVAVNNLSMKVYPGQCFGLLGVNGAGKSTTFRMLTTEHKPTSGKILINGNDIGREPLYDGQLGYCPQGDAMDPKLTTLQCLNFYATLKGITNIQMYSKRALTMFGLQQYANQRVENLSGGNKRKLCAAVALLGKAPIILMDEPTSGMDSHSRQLMASVLRKVIKDNRSVILTSHSMEESETLCSQVAILIDGRAECTGTPQDLKDRYGAGYIVDIKTIDPKKQTDLNTLMMTKFPGLSLQYQHHCFSRYLVPIDHLSVSQLFDRMTQISAVVDIEDFTLSHSTLDQVFVNLTNSQDKSVKINLENGLKPESILMTSLKTSKLEDDEWTHV